MDLSAWITLLTLWSPALAAAILACVPSSAERFARIWTFVATLAVFLLAVVGYLLPTSPARFDVTTADLQHVVDVAWLPAFDIRFTLGLDGISFPLVVLALLIAVLAAAAGNSIKQHVKAYCILFLLLQTGILGVFLAQDFFLFYVFWEAMLLPMYFLIGIWGGPRKEYAAIKFFLYTLVGGVLMLIAMLVLYFQSDLRGLARAAETSPAAAQRLAELADDDALSAKLGVAVLEDESGGRAVVFRGEWIPDRPLDIVTRIDETATESKSAFDEEAGSVEVTLPPGATVEQFVAAIESNVLLASAASATVLPKVDAARSSLVKPNASLIDAAPLTLAAPVSYRPIHTFSLPLLADLGLETEVFPPGVQRWCFLALFLGFLIKLPGVPVHTWLPDAHVEAPTPISMILAGVLLKMGGYGLLRVAYPLCPFGAHEYAWLVAGIGVITMIYGALAAMAQKDFKRLVAYSSVSHMGYVLLGLGAWSAGIGTGFDSSYWNMGAQGAMFQMLAHGISSAGMFFIVGMLYDRVKHRDLGEFGGIYGRMPAFSALSFGIFFANMGLPGLCGFVGEVLVVFSAWRFDAALAIAAAATTVLTAAYILIALQKVFLGAEYRGPYSEKLVPMTAREGGILGVLFVLSILLGVFPHTFGFRWFDATFDRQYERLASWTERTLPAYERYLQREAQARDAAEEAMEESALDEAALPKPTEPAKSPAIEPESEAGDEAAPTTDASSSLDDAGTADADASDAADVPIDD